MYIKQTNKQTLQKNEDISLFITSLLNEILFGGMVIQKCTMLLTSQLSEICSLSYMCMSRGGDNGAERSEEWSGTAIYLL